jgi:hypothetical protein
VTTPTAAVPAVGYRLIEKPSRITAVDTNDIEICGARQPYGYEYWHVYMTVRVTDNLHQVIATTRETAIEHVRTIANLYMAKAVA